MVQSPAVTVQPVMSSAGPLYGLSAGSAVLNAAGAEVGQVVSGTLSPILNEAIGSALVDAAAAKEALQADIRGTKLNLQLVKPPFVPLKKT